MDLKNIKVLLADNSSSMRGIVKSILKELEFTYIFEDENGNVAIEVLRKENFDLILAEWNMPKMNDLELLKAVRR